MKINQQNKRLDTEIYRDIIMDLSFEKILIDSRLLELKKQNKTIEETPKAVVIDIITTNQKYLKKKNDYINIIKRETEIEFDEELIEDRDVGYILLDYFADVNIKYYQTQEYYKLIWEMVSE